MASELVNKNITKEHPTFRLLESQFFICLYNICVIFFSDVHEDTSVNGQQTYLGPAISNKTGSKQ